MRGARIRAGADGSSPRRAGVLQDARAPRIRSPVNPVTGVSLKILSALAFTLMAATIKLASTDYPIG